VSMMVARVEEAGGLGGGGLIEHAHAREKLLNDLIIQKCEVEQPNAELYSRIFFYNNMRNVNKIGIHSVCPRIPDSGNDGFNF
jgi:hypothetical protein